MKALTKGIILSMTALSLQGCIHEYPVYIPGKGPDKGEDPTIAEAYIEVECLLSWENMMHRVDFDTRAREETGQRLIFEISKNGESVVKDIEYLLDTDFSSGIFRHRISLPLEKDVYSVAVWYDIADKEGNRLFSANSLNEVFLADLSTSKGEFYQCAHASDILDLRDEKVIPDEPVVKNLKLEYPGARFEIVATDINEFIAQKKEALNQGDSFKTHIKIAAGGFSNFNVFSGKLYSGEAGFEFSGKMRLPFDEYDELKIAEGFIFCYPEDEVSMQLSIENSANTTVSHTEFFNFPEHQHWPLSDQ